MLPLVLTVTMTLALDTLTVHQSSDEVAVMPGKSAVFVLDDDTVTDSLPAT